MKTNKYFLLVKLYFMCRRYRWYAENGKDQLKVNIVVFIFGQSKAMYDVLAPRWWPAIRPLNSTAMEA